MPDYEAYKYSPSAALQHSVRWAQDEEIQRVTHKIRLSDHNCVVKGGLPIISDGDTVYVDASDAHNLIIGSTGSKKTRLFAMPMLEILRRAGESVLVTDPKGELYDLTAQSFADCGYHVQVINLRDPSRSDGWNPLAMARNFWNAGDTERATSTVNDFATAMMKGEQGSGGNAIFWEHVAISMLQGLALMMVEEPLLFPDETVNLATLNHLSKKFIQDTNARDPGVMDLIGLYPEDSIARMNIQTSSGGSEGTFSNIKVSYDAPMQRLYAQKTLVSMLSKHEIDFSRLGTEKTILYLIMPDEKTTLHKIVSLIIKLCYEHLIYTAQHQTGNTLPQRVNFLLDEFSNLPAIPDIAAMISAARSRNIRFHLIIQGFYQLNSKYGDNDAQTIKGNCTNWVYLTSRELPLLNEISELCGIEDSTYRRLITVSELQRLDKDRGEALILLGRQAPYLTHLADISTYKLPAPPCHRPLPYMSTDTPPIRTVADAMDILLGKQPGSEHKASDNSNSQTTCENRLDKLLDTLFSSNSEKKNTDTSEES